MTEQKKFNGLIINEALFQGRVIEDPQIVQGGAGECAWIKLETIVGELSANGQWIDSEQVVPLLVLEEKKVNVVKQYVKEGRELLVWCYYKTWTVDGQINHGLVVTKLKLGRTPYQPQQEQ